MKKVKEEKTPLIYKERGILKKIDFSDTFSTINKQDTLKEIANLIFNDPPNWVKLLFTLRNKMVKIIGLKNSVPKGFKETFDVGGYIGFFKIYAISNSEIILGADDSHLNFRAIILKDNTSDYNIKTITLVEYNNMKGSIYMSLIKPFHRIVVKSLVKKAYKNKYHITTKPQKI